MKATQCLCVPFCGTDVEQLVQARPLSGDDIFSGRRRRDVLVHVVKAARRGNRPLVLHFYNVARGTTVRKRNVAHRWISQKTRWCRLPSVAVRRVLVVPVVPAAAAIIFPHHCRQQRHVDCARCVSGRWTAEPSPNKETKVCRFFQAQQASPACFVVGVRESVVVHPATVCVPTSVAPKLLLGVDDAASGHEAIGSWTECVALCSSLIKPFGPPHLLALVLCRRCKTLRITVYSKLVHTHINLQPRRGRSHLNPLHILVPLSVSGRLDTSNRCWSNTSLAHG